MAAQSKTPYNILRMTKAPTGTAPGVVAKTQSDAVATRRMELELVAVDVEAHNATAAVRSYAEALDQSDGISGRYVAVPSRSWKEIGLGVETQTILRLTG